MRILRVVRPPGFHFSAGQAVKLGLPAGSLRHSYSIASAPHEPALEFCIEAVPGGRLTPALFGLTPGDRVALSLNSKGRFALDPNKRRHLMLATVTGIAPLRSMLRHALAQRPAESGPPSQFVILHGASYADELPYASELAALARTEPQVRYVPTVSRPAESRNSSWTQARGRVEALVMPLLQRLGSPHEVAVYACGNPDMITTVRQMLLPLGYHVRSEAFA